MRRLAWLREWARDLIRSPWEPWVSLGLCDWAVCQGRGDGGADHDSWIPQRLRNLAVIHWHSHAITNSLPRTFRRLRCVIKPAGIIPGAKYLSKRISGANKQTVALSVCPARRFSCILDTNSLESCRYRDICPSYNTQRRQQPDVCTQQ